VKTGDRIIFEDMAHYTMVKTNTFNGIRLPNIALRGLDGEVKVVKRFDYSDFKGRLG
jgi:carboxynorspermidine decarboxylase